MENTEEKRILKIWIKGIIIFNLCIFILFVLSIVYFLMERIGYFVFLLTLITLLIIWVIADIGYIAEIVYKYKEFKKSEKIQPFENCPHCGEKISYNSDVCIKCGEKIKKSKLDLIKEQMTPKSLSKLEKKEKEALYYGLKRLLKIFSNSNNFSAVLFSFKKNIDHAKDVISNSKMSRNQ